LPLTAGKGAIIILAGDSFREPKRQIDGRALIGDDKLIEVAERHSREALMQLTVEKETSTWNSPSFEYIPVNCEVTAYSGGDLDPDGI
jgi:hypothetical protein